MERKKKHNTKYSPEFKISVIMDMRENHLAYRETARKYKLGNSVCQGKNLAIKWERIYLEEGAEGLMEERRGRKSAGFVLPRTVIDNQGNRLNCRKLVVCTVFRQECCLIILRRHRFLDGRHSTGCRLRCGKC